MSQVHVGYGVVVRVLGRCAVAVVVTVVAVVDNDDFIVVAVGNDVGDSRGVVCMSGEDGGLGAGGARPEAITFLKCETCARDFKCGKKSYLCSALQGDGLMHATHLSELAFAA
jgi:hypothetical protein